MTNKIFEIMHNVCNCHDRCITIKHKDIIRIYCPNISAEEIMRGIDEKLQNTPYEAKIVNPKTIDFQKAEKEF